MRRSDGAGWSIDVNDCPASRARSAERLQLAQHQVAAKGKGQLLENDKNFDQVHGEQRQMGGRGTVPEDATNASRMAVNRAWYMDSVRDKDSSWYAAAAAGYIKQTSASDAIEVPRSRHTLEGVKRKQTSGSIEPPQAHATARTPTMRICAGSCSSCCSHPACSAQVAAYDLRAEVIRFTNDENIANMARHPLCDGGG